MIYLGVICDQCGEDDVAGQTTLPKARRALRATGWTLLYGGITICPGCAYENQHSDPGGDL